ncbi:hypothetical protein [Bifidobacterium callitrichidarum]|uniref:Uncharacterized protein n=1 Tax=Bifidobacterium callitrichidarum TaxID=2052941 RepID=A0A2U2N914_9BIFI|nr:hypothetical protein [Bifidobacterium callitrichidarum]PWG65608.1 hypothetical protein DF196_06655 [Bifidobacterium callitrichidarum]
MTDTQPFWTGLTPIELEGTPVLLDVFDRLVEGTLAMTGDGTASTVVVSVVSDRLDPPVSVFDAASPHHPVEPLPAARGLTRVDPMRLGADAAPLAGDRVELRGVPGLFPYAGRADGRRVRVRMGSGPDPVWVPRRNIAAIVRDLRLTPGEPGLYRTRDGGILLRDGSGRWRRIFDAAGEGDGRWPDPGAAIGAARLRALGPLSRIRLGES